MGDRPFLSVLLLGVKIQCLTSVLERILASHMVSLLVFEASLSEDFESQSEWFEFQ